MVQVTDWIGKSDILTFQIKKKKREREKKKKRMIFLSEINKEINAHLFDNSIYLMSLHQRPCCRRGNK